MNVYIGENAGATGRVFNGTIDDVRVYNVALSASQVSALYYQSTTYTWVGTTTSWTTATNWSPYGPPGAGDTAVVAATSSSTYPLLTAATSCKNLQIAGSASVDLNGNALTLGGTLSNGGTIFLQGAESINAGAGFSSSAGNVNYYGTIDYSTAPGKLVAGNTYSALSFTGSAGIWKLNANASASSVLVASGSTLDLSTFGISNASTFTNNGTVRISGGAQAISGTKTNGTTSTVVYYGAGAGLAWGGSYQNLTINGSGTFPASTAVTIPGTLTLSAGALSSGANQVTLSGNFVSTGGTFSSTGLFLFNGTGPQAFNPTGSSFSAITVNATGPVTLGGALTMSGGLALTSGTLAAGGNGVSVGGNISRGSGLITSTGLVTLNGTGTQSVDFTSSTLSSLTVSNTSGANPAVTLASAVTVPATFTHSSGTIELSGHAISVTGPASLGATIQNSGLAAGISVGGITTLSGNASLSTNGGAVIFSNTVDATSSGAQGLTVNAGAGTVSFGGAVGGSMPLASLSVTSTAAAVNAITLGNVTTGALGGAQTYTGKVTLGTTATLGTNNGNVSFTGTVDGTGAGAQGLTVSAGTGTVSFGGAVGGNTTLSAFSVNSASSFTTSAGASLTVAGAGAISITADAVSIAAAMQTTSGPVTIQPVTAARTIAINDATGALSISAAALGFLTTSGTVTIGSATGSGAVNIGSLGTINPGKTWNLVIRSSTGNATFNLAGRKHPATGQQQQPHVQPGHGNDHSRRNGNERRHPDRHGHSRVPDDWPGRRPGNTPCRQRPRCRDLDTFRSAVSARFCGCECFRHGERGGQSGPDRSLCRTDSHGQRDSHKWRRGCFGSLHG